jgi:hypothetical protein
MLGNVMRRRSRIKRWTWRDAFLWASMTLCAAAFVLVLVMALSETSG